MATKTGKKTREKKTYTAEEIAGFRARDAAILESGDAVMARPDAGARMAAVVQVPGFSRMSTYSFRNQARLIGQAEALGMPMDDVDTFNGWIERGRIVRKGQKAQLYIAKFVGTEQPDEDAEATEDEGQDDEETPAKPRFRMSPRFELSQTDELTEADRVEAAQAFHADAEDPAAVWLATLTTTAEKLGYQVTTVADGTGVDVDDDAEEPTITVAGAQEWTVLGELAQALAERISTADTERKAKKARKAAEKAAKARELSKV